MAGDYQTCDIVVPPWEDGALSYLRDSAVSFQVWKQEQETVQRYVLSYTAWPEESHVSFAIESAEPEIAES